MGFYSSYQANKKLFKNLGTYEAERAIEILDYIDNEITDLINEININE